MGDEREGFPTVLRFEPFRETSGDGAVESNVAIAPTSGRNIGGTGILSAPVSPQSATILLRQARKISEAFLGNVKFAGEKSGHYEKEDEITPAPAVSKEPINGP